MNAAPHPTTRQDSVPEGLRALVIGASGGIGQAFVQAHPRCGEVLARHLIIHAAGVLHGDGILPEKKLGDLNHAQLEATSRTNTFGPALVLRHFAPLLDTGRGVLAVLSAKVGSIGDNRLTPTDSGGFFAYTGERLPW